MLRKDIPQFVKVASLKVGDTLYVGEDTGCLKRGEVVSVTRCPDTLKLAVKCSRGFHNLESVVTGEGEVKPFYAHTLAPRGSTMRLVSAVA